MIINGDFQMVCGDCGSLEIKIENPEGASRDAIVYCGHCGASRGTTGALRDLAARYPKLPKASRSPSFGSNLKKRKLPSQTLEQFREFQSFRRRVRRVGSVQSTPHISKLPVPVPVVEGQ